ncbi:MAG TPA: sugar ABC transporter permease [Candidatus Pelethocola excrementipullorum]|nr:sugar ABC transporter permease [Candidatus Pelethocola excrementipullorum]
MIPIIVVIFGVMGYPFLRAVYLSFTDKVVGAKETFAGLKNYESLISDPIYWKSLKNTFIYTAGCIGAKFLLGLLLAVILNQSFKGKGFFRTVLLIPWAIPGMVAATTWRWMYDSTYGIINSLLIAAGITKVGVSWLSDTHLTLLSTMIVNIWRGVPFFMFSILGALQTLDKQQYEAAYVDGAGSLRQFWYITLPSIAGVLGITTLLSTIWTFNDFENVYLITGGGPLYSSSTIATYTYDMAFIQNNFAGALSVAVSVVPILLVLILIYTKHNKEA